MAATDSPDWTRQVFVTNLAAALTLSTGLARVDRAAGTFWSALIANPSAARGIIAYLDIFTDVYPAGTQQLVTDWVINQYTPQGRYVFGTSGGNGIKLAENNFGALGAPMPTGDILLAYPGSGQPSGSPGLDTRLTPLHAGGYVAIGVTVAAGGGNPADFEVRYSWLP